MPVVVFVLSSVDECGSCATLDGSWEGTRSVSEIFQGVGRTCGWPYGGES